MVEPSTFFTNYALIMLITVSCIGGIAIVVLISIYMYKKCCFRDEAAVPVPEIPLPAPEFIF